VSQTAEHPIEIFRRRLVEQTAYPPGVIPVPEYLPGTAFFSAAAGLVVTDPGGPLPHFPFGGVMFVGHNLDSETAFMRRLASGRSHGDWPRPMLTWRNLYRLLEKAEVDPVECFFTNAYVGLKAGDNPTGRFPGATDPTFRAWCRGFLEEQIAVMRPRVVASLGTDARQFLATMAPELAAWAPRPNPPPDVVGTNLGGVNTTAVALLHRPATTALSVAVATEPSRAWMRRRPCSVRHSARIPGPASRNRVHHGSVGSGRGVASLTGIIRRIPRPVQVVLIVAWGAAAFWDKSSAVDKHQTPLGVSIVLGAGCVVIAVFGLIRFLRSWYASDRPPFDPISRGWFLFVVVAGTLLVLPVVDLFRRDPNGSPPIETAMFVVGLGLVGLVVQYARKPVWDEGIPINEFIAEDRQRGRSARVAYGGGWRTAADPSGLYLLVWIEETHEICAVRGPLVPPWLRLAPESAYSSILLGDGGTIHFLGWADNRSALDRALVGWERHMDEPDSLAWVREQLALAAAETERERVGRPGQ